MLTNMKLLFTLLSIATFIGFTHQQSSGGCDCGLPNRRTRIVGGQNTTIGEYPWMCELYKVTRNQNNQIIANESACGATLIANRYVLTAAHCVNGQLPGNFIIDLGDQDLSTGNEVTNQIVDVISITVHSSYNTTTHENDIAILQLAISITYTSNIKPICIPPPSLNVAGTSLVVTGWGTLYNNGPSSLTLQEVTLPVLPNNQCKANYSQTPNARISDSVICTQYTGTVKQDACQGDSGGPAAVECGGRYMLAGITSYSIGCAVVPGVYTNVSYYRSWIVQNLPPYTLCGYDCYPSPLPAAKTCGVANTVSSTGRRKRVVGGSITQPHEFPWMAGIYIFDSTENKNFFACGATLISSQYVMTAATCIFNIPVNDIEIVLGDFDQNNINEVGEKSFTAANVIIHPNFNKNSKINNIALIKLSSSATIKQNSSIFPICLPASSVPTDFSPGTRLVFLGWGIDQSGRYPNKLKQISVPTIASSSCEFNFASSAASAVCTVQTNTSRLCTGDQGGPFILQDSESTYFQMALQSFPDSTLCLPNNTLSVNLKIEPFVDWITSVSQVQPVSPVGELY